MDLEKSMDSNITLGSDILVIDDSAVILAVVRGILDKKYSVRIAQSAKAAYMCLEEKIPDLILLDLEMPEVNGFEFLKLISDNPDWKGVPVIFLTGIDDRKKEEQALELGAVEYILKPIAEGVLMKRVQFHLELRTYQKKLEQLVESRTNELLRTQEELEKAVDVARKALRAKSTFLANMSHEIRTPMNSIMGFSELTLDSDIPPQVGGYVKKIKDSTIILLRVINDILDISKIEAGKMEIEHISFCPGTVIDNCQTMIIKEISNKGLVFKVNIDKPLKEKQFLGDPVRLYQSILNLLSNSAKFTKSGTITLTASMVDRGEEHGEEYAQLKFEIEDTGVGITEEHLGRIYEPFAQVSGGEFTRINEGTGLGLPITKHLIELMGGKLTVESEYGVGTKFTIDIKLPVTSGESLFDDVFGDAAYTNTERPSFSGVVLVCEDNKLNQRVIKEHLGRIGLTTVIAETGLEGLDIVMDRMKKREKPFDLILMDMQMPVMDGFEATARINALGTGVPIVALAANVMAADLEDYKRSGLMDCIGKPFQTWDLWRCLLSILTPENKEGFIAEKPSPQPEEKPQRSVSATSVPSNNTVAKKDGKKGILIVDDEKSNIIALTHFLRDDYSVYVTRDSRDANEMARNHKPDIILLDILMPEMDGYEVIEELKATPETQHIPVIFISGLSTPEAMGKGLALGAADYIPKPFEASVVKDKIKRLLM